MVFAMIRRWVLPLLILSGFAGLSYELLWVRLLALHLGSTTVSFSVVLGVFFGGLAAGSRWAGKRSLSVTRPLRAYAVLEALTGVLGLLLYPVLTHLAPLVAKLDPGTGVPALLFRLGVSIVMLTPPTFLMGATLPFITVATIKANDETGRGVSLIYGFNTAGACLGAYAVTFWLLPSLGVFGATLVTVGLNLLVAGVVLLATRGTDTDTRAATVQSTEALPAPTPDEVDTKARSAAMVAAFIGGLVATGAQIIWARYFAILLGGTTYGIGSVLVSVLVGIAAGSFVAARAVKRSRHVGLTAATFMWLVLAGLFAFVAGVPLITYVATLATTAGVGGTWLHHADMLVVWLSIGACTIASGACLPALTAVVEKDATKAGQSLARLYTANTLGCILGSLVTGLVLLPALGSATTIYLLFVLLVVALTLVLVASCRERLGPALALGVTALAASVWFPQLDMRQVMPRAPATTDYFSFRRALESSVGTTSSFYEGDVATVRVVGSSATKGISLNGLGQGTHYETPPHIAFESVLVATIPFQHAERYRRGLVVGLGSGGTASALLDLGVERLEVAELEHGVIDAVEEIWGASSPLKNPRLTLVANDARNYLLTQSSREPKAYDFVTSMPAHPWVASALFTREFFELANANLADHGVFATWFGPADMPDNAIEGLFGAFTRTFPHWLVYFVPEARAFYLVGSRSKLTFDVERIRALSTASVYRGFDPRSIEPQFFAARLTAHSEGPATAKLENTDDNGLIEFGVQSPRKKPLLDTLGYLPVRGLTPGLIVGAPAEAFLLETLETLLSTPHGDLPQAPTGGASARRMIASLRTSTPDLARYADARLALINGKTTEVERLRAGLPDELARRLDRFSAAAEPDLAKRRERLGALPPRTDVRLALVAAGAPVEPIAPSEGDTDDGAWLFASPEAWRALDAETAARKTRALVERLTAFNEAAPFARCERLLTEAGLAGHASVCRARFEERTQGAARRLVSRALEAGSKEDYVQVLALFRQADGLVPLDIQRAKLFLQTAVKLGKPEAITEGRALLLARGFAPVTLDAMIEGFRREPTK